MDLAWWQELLICVPVCCACCTFVDWLRDKYKAKKQRKSYQETLRALRALDEISDDDELD